AGVVRSDVLAPAPSARTRPRSHPSPPATDRSGSGKDVDGARQPPAPGTIQIDGNESLRVGLEEGRNLFLAARARRGENWESLAARFLGKGAPSAPLVEANPPGEPVTAGRWYRVPIYLATPEWRARILRAAFPGDGPSETGWVHRPAASPLDTYGEGAWEAALWYTGDGRNFEVVLRSNSLTDPLLAREAAIMVPAH